MTTKTALITGASSGIGKELAYIHAEQGGNLIIVARRADKLNALKTELENQYGVKVMVIAKDLTSLAQRVLTAAIPLTPKKMLLRQVRQMQEVEA